MMIKVRTLTGKLIEFDVEPTDTVRVPFSRPSIPRLAPDRPAIEDVKKRVEEKEGILPAQQRLIYSGKQMHDDVKLGEGGVVPDATLHLVLTLRGGAGPRYY
ncbi:hypothetical protein ONZ43_g5431 [Nemania bipapillata]|uniref:Uncharacterized protein n=1 Tax=Nemania bipapillata TaxID=110536 RepID=A0ACC2IAV2_9PEZI|nr:hypothetical protein ONZ43_g5431 [Nemania bipapillata]